MAPRCIDPAGGVGRGISTLEVHGVGLRPTDPDRTALDLGKLRRRVQSADLVLPRFARLGRHLGVWGRVEPVGQGMMAR